jgi:hypothetical protein
MRKSVFALLIALLILSCSVDEGEGTSYVLLPIESIQLPNEFTLNEEYEIPIVFKRPTNCHGYYDIFLKGDSEIRTLAVQCIVYENPNCKALVENNQTNESFIFKVLYDQVYVFRIWKGIDEFGEEIYEEIEVPVVN